MLEQDESLKRLTVYLQISRQGQICGCYLPLQAGLEPRPSLRERRYLYMRGAARAWEQRTGVPPAGGWADL